MPAFKLYSVELLEIRTRGNLIGRRIGTTDLKRLKPVTTHYNRIGTPAKL